MHDFTRRRREVKAQAYKPINQLGLSTEPISSRFETSTGTLLQKQGRNFNVFYHAQLISLRFASIAHLMQNYTPFVVTLGRLILCSQVAQPTQLSIFLKLVNGCSGEIPREQA